MTELHVDFLGTAASMPTAKRGLASTLITRDGQSFLFDCGEGTQRQMMKGPGLKAPRAIFITHYHPDHWLGLPGLISTLKMNEHTERLTVYGPSDGIGTIEMICQRSGAGAEFASFVGVDPGTIWFRHDPFRVKVFKTKHTPNSVGYLFREEQRPGRFDVELARRLGVEPGPLYKRLQDGHSVQGNYGPVSPSDVIGDPRPGRSVAITGDTAPCPSVVDGTYGADLLVHDATFTSDMWQRARKTKHSTGTGAGGDAYHAEVKRLALTHFSARSDVAQIAREASVACNCPVQAAHDGLRITIPLED